MARPKTKEELKQAGTLTYQKLMDLIDTLSQQEKNGCFAFDLEKNKEAHWGRDQNIKDVLIHLYEWQALLLHWVSSNGAGSETSFLPEGYNWKTYGTMNVELWKKHQSTSLEQALVLLQESHDKVLAMEDDFTQEELFEKNQFPWVGGSTLGSYVVSCTSSHYEWALKKIKKYIKENAV